MSEPTHPGSIRFIDETQSTEKVEPVSAVPASIAFATVNGAKVPVVKVVLSGAGDRREIRSYGADGALLATTYGHVGG
jgi:hypothetical protein